MIRTLRDVQDVLSLVDQGFSNQEILQKIRSGQLHLSEVATIKGKCFCSKCEQPITLVYCHECGQTLPVGRKL